MDWRKPASSRELRQSFGIGGVLFVQSRRQAFVGFTSVDAVGGQLQTNQSVLEPIEPSCDKFY